MFVISKMNNLLSISDYHREIQDEANKEAFKTTCHYLKLIAGNPHPYATGVFTIINNCHFLFTAAHVIDGVENEIFIGYEEHKVVKLGGEWITKSLPQGKKREEDKIDVAILKLDNESIEFVKNRYEFLQDNDIQVNHKIIEAPLYSAIGFPASRNKFNKYKNELKSNPFIYITHPASNEIYYQLECNTFLNIIIHYDKQNVFNHKTNQYITGPNPWGISGGGLWYVPSQLVKSGGKIEKKLVGILTEWPIKNRKYWIATKIDIYTEIIRKKYNLKIEQSKQVKIDL
jgi:hypothetical protein